MVRGLRERLGRKFDEEVRFFRGWQRDKKGVGAVIPTSAITARRMASVINPESGLPVLELGAGTGVITKAILDLGVQPKALVSVEYSRHFFEALVERFPAVDFCHGDAFDLDATLGERRRDTFDCVISAVPMLSFPVERRIRLMKDLLERIPAGRPVIQITYGPMPPVPALTASYEIRHYDFVVRNIPPAQLWLYRKAV